MYIFHQPLSWYPYYRYRDTMGLARSGRPLASQAKVFMASAGAGLVSNTDLGLQNRGCMITEVEWRYLRR